MLALKLAAGERIYVGDDGSFIELARIGGRHAVIACDFPRDVTLLRGVLWDRSHPQSETPEPSGEPTDDAAGN